MILESIKDLILLDPLLTSYLRSNNYTGSPLHASRRQNVQVHSPNKTKVNIEISAIKIIDAIIRDESIDADLLNLEEYQILLEVVSKAFRCVYSSLSKTQDYINVIKKHQVYIIKLIALKKIDVSSTELGLLHQVINKVINVQSFIDWYNPSRLTYQELLYGIPFNETFLDCLDGNYKLQIVNLTIAFHFMCIQSLLQTITLNLKLIISNRDSNLNLSIFGTIAPYFLSTGNFSQWLVYSYSEFSNKDKHINNLNKMINGFLKIIGILTTKVKGSNLIDLYHYQSLFTIKSIEYQLLKSGDYSNIQILELNAHENAQLIPYIDDVKSVLSNLQGPSSVSLEKLQIELDRIQLPPARYSRTDIISAVNEVIKNPSNSSLNELGFCLLSKVTYVTELASDPEFLHSMKLFINAMICSKDKNLAYYSIQICMSYFNFAFKTLKNLSCAHLTIFDSITIYIKDQINSEKPEQSFFKFLCDTLQNLFNIISKFRQFKRIRNLSNLFYNLANRDKTMSEEYWKLAISYELFIYNYNTETKTTENFKFLQSKIQKIVNALYETKKFNESSSILLDFLRDVIDNNKSGHKEFFIDLAEFKMPLIIQLLAKCLVSDASIVNSIFGAKSKISENFKCIIFIHVVCFFEKSNNVRQKTDLINYIMAKLYLKDSTLKLICIYHYYNLNGLNHFVQDLFTDSYPSNEVSILFLSGVGLQEILNKGWNENSLTNSLGLFEEWLERSEQSDVFIMDYEIEILKTFVNYLLYNSLTGQVIYLIQTYKRYRSTLGNSPKNYLLKLLLELELCGACLKLGLSLDASNYLTSSGILLKELSKYSTNNDCLHVSNQDLINWKLLQFEYCLLLGNKSHAKEKFIAILKFLDSKPEFNLKNQGPDITLETKFCNLFIIARFQLLTCKLNIQLSNFYDALDNVKLSIKVLYSIIKKMGNNIRKIAFNEMKWKTASLLLECYKTIINLFSRLGISRDLLYYILELKKLDQVNIHPLVNCSNSFYLSNYYIILDNIEDAYLSLIQGNNIFKLILMDNRNIRYASLLSNVLFSAADLRLDTKRNENKRYTMTGIDGYKHELDTLLDFSWEQLSSISKSSLISMSSMIDPEAERIQFQYLLSLYELHSTLQLRDFNHLETNQYSKLLITIFLAKIQNLNAYKLLLSIPCFSLMDESSIALPCIIKEGHKFQRSVDSITCNVSTDVDTANNLIQTKEILINCLILKRLTQLSNYELNDLHKVLFRCLSLLSSVATFKSDFSLERSHNSVLSYLYYLQDLPKYLPFLNDRNINHDTVTSQSNNNELLPSEISEKCLSKEVDLATSEFFKDLIDYLPSSWIIITVDICPYSGDLLLSKVLKDSCSKPFFLRIPLNKRATKGDSPELLFKEMVKSLNSIIKQSDLSTRPETTSKIKTKEDRKNWWKLRFSLDLELKSLLDQVENDWFGGFKGIFDDPFIYKPFLSSFRLDLDCLLNEMLPTRMMKITENKFMEFDDNVLELLLSMCQMFEGESAEVSDTELRKKNYKFLNDLIYFILDSLMYHGEQNAYDEIDIEKFHSLLEKLLMTYYQKKNKFLSQKSNRESHIILVPSAKCSSFPWESLNCLRGKSISRVPSIGILVDMLKHRHKSLNINKSNNLYYLINPGGDLIRTQTKFKPLFSGKENWEGLIGVQPDGDEILQKLNEKNLFIYLGHGGCEQFIRTSSLFKAICNDDNRSLPPSLLIGCSSGALNYNGLLEPNGNIYNWLICGSPMVVANLWDVTDKDIDKFSLSVFERWGLLEDSEGSNNVNICQAVSDSRQKCTLKYLNGSAPIVYGLPMLLV